MYLNILIFNLYVWWAWAALSAGGCIAYQLRVKATFRNVRCNGNSSRLGTCLTPLPPPTNSSHPLSAEHPVHFITRLSLVSDLFYVEMQVRNPVR